ncbi:hypothetical protein BT69DRAFT_1301976 [Atractiella rhizophila]|nr:hypothetical protein BT69DRAFT_1301976 [Atractiella rhizophila]
MFSRLVHTIAALPKPSSPRSYEHTVTPFYSSQQEETSPEDEDPIYPWTSAPRQHQKRVSQPPPTKKRRTTFLSLPYELRLRIVDYLRFSPTEEWPVCRSTLIALSETSKVMRHFIGPLIFAKLCWSYRQGLVDGTRRAFWDIAETFPSQFLKDINEVSISLTDWAVKADMGWKGKGDGTTNGVNGLEAASKEEERWRLMRINYLVTCFNFLRRLLKQAGQVKSLTLVVASDDYERLLLADNQNLLISLLTAFEPISRIENLHISANEMIADRLMKFFSSTIKTLHGVPPKYHDPSPSANLRTLSSYTYEYMEGIDVFEYVKKRTPLGLGHHPPSQLTSFHITYKGDDLSAFIPFWPVMSIIFASETTLRDISVNAALVLLEREKPLDAGNKQVHFPQLRTLKTSIILLKDPSSLVASPTTSRAAAIESDPWTFFRYFSKSPVQEIWYQRFMFNGGSGSVLQHEAEASDARGYTKSSNFDNRVPISIGLTRGEGKSYWTELRRLRFPEKLKLDIRDELEMELSLRKIQITRRDW